MQSSKVRILKGVFAGKAARTAGEVVELAASEAQLLFSLRRAEPFVEGAVAEEAPESVAEEAPESVAEEPINEDPKPVKPAKGGKGK